MIFSRQRRTLLLSAAGSLLTASCNSLNVAQKSRPLGKVVVVGAGFGGTTCAKYLRLWSNGRTEVTLIDPKADFISCPLSNLVLGGFRTIEDLTLSYRTLQKHWGVILRKTSATGFDATARLVHLADGSTLPYDHLVLSPGIDFALDGLPSLKAADAFDSIPHAWQAGQQTTLLRRQLVAMPDGGIFAICIPAAPYRCPPGPYERACLVADFLQRFKPRAKLLILDANDKIQSKEGLFKKAFSELYAQIIEYRPNSALVDVRVTEKIAVTDFESVRCDVLNVIPPQKAGAIATANGLQLANQRWVTVDWRTHESTNTPRVHVLGDALMTAPMMPKSAYMANQHGKVAAAAIIDQLSDRAPNQDLMLINTCYSFVDAQQAIHVSSVHRYNPTSHTYDANPNGSGGVSNERNEQEGALALQWARNLWADSLN